MFQFNFDLGEDLEGLSISDEAPKLPLPDAQFEGSSKTPARSSREFPLALLVSLITPYLVPIHA